jgi:type I restriction enzyme, S subunit
MSQWPAAQLGKVIEQRKDFVLIDDFTEYKRCRVQLHAQGIVLRDTVSGAEIKTKKQQVCKAGDFLVAEIDAKVGGFGIVPDDLDGAIVSSHYFLFDVNQEKLNGSFLDYFIRTPNFRDQVTAQGSTNYAAIRPNDVLGYEIPLPSLSEQRRIVTRIEELAAKIDEARGLRQEAAAETKRISAASYRAAFSFQRGSTSIGNVCEVIDPNPSHRYPAYVPEGVPIVSSSEFRGDDDIDPTLAKRVPESFYSETLGRYGVGEGDLIFSRKGKVGYARLHPAGINLAMTHTLCVMKPNRHRLDPRYLLHFARSPFFLEELTGTMNPNVGVPTLGLQVIRNTKIPIRTISEQRCVAANLDSLLSRVYKLEKLQGMTASELDALLPSILDKAFHGELE